MQESHDTTSETVTRSPEQVFAEFKRLHPQSVERYLPLPGNIRRWESHIEHASKLKEMQTQKAQKKPLPESFAALIEQRRITTWDDFSKGTQFSYRIIAELFPGHDVYACGSRVRGDYVSGSDSDVVREWRRQAGKAAKFASDYDFWVDLSAEPMGGIPEWADRLRHGVPDDEKILIPMEQWDFSKLPASEHRRVIDLYNAGQWRELANIHDDYHLSNYSYCCDLSGLKLWFRFGIESGKIKADASK